MLFLSFHSSSTARHVKFTVQVVSEILREKFLKVQIHRVVGGSNNGRFKDWIMRFWRLKHKIHTLNFDSSWQSPVWLNLRTKFHSPSPKSLHNQPSPLGISRFLIILITSWTAEINLSPEKNCCLVFILKRKRFAKICFWRRKGDGKVVTKINLITILSAESLIKIL